MGKSLRWDNFSMFQLQKKTNVPIYTSATNILANFVEIIQAWRGKELPIFDSSFYLLALMRVMKKDIPQCNGWELLVVFWAIFPSKNIKKECNKWHPFPPESIVHQEKIGEGATIFEESPSNIRSEYPQPK